jgi:transcriptional regulator with XRE-family HTH domain
MQCEQEHSMSDSKDKQIYASRLTSGKDARVPANERRNAQALFRLHRERIEQDQGAATLTWIVRVGSMLRQARTKLSLRQEDMAERSGVTQGYLSNVENGKLVRGPTLDVLYRYANALGCEFEMTLRDTATGEVVARVGSSLRDESGVAAAETDWDIGPVDIGAVIASGAGEVAPDEWVSVPEMEVRIGEAVPAGGGVVVRSVSASATVKLDEGTARLRALQQSLVQSDKE